MFRVRRVVLSLVLLSGLLTVGSATPAVALELRAPCDSLDPSLCLLPFPNDRFTRVDPTTDTGLRIDFQVAEMPRVANGKPIDPTEWNRNDGFSPGSAVMTFVPGLDLHETWGTAQLSTGGPNDPADHMADISRYSDTGAPILLIDATTGERWPFVSELDNNAGTAPDERLLILRPAVNFLEGHRYLVGLRSMLDSNGDAIEAGAEFAAYRDGTPAPLADETRRAEVEAIIDEMDQAEVARGNSFEKSDLFLAWDFTVASGTNLSERVLHIRDDAFAQLGDTNLADSTIQGAAPTFTVTENLPRTDGARQRQIRGFITVPNYLDKPPMPPVETISTPVENVPGQSIPGGRFFYGGQDLPQQNPAIPTLEAPFVCTIPALASATDKAHPYLYGHGLLGSRNESTGGSTDRMRERNFLPCAVDWIGMADEDIANALAILADPSNMPSLVDRAQQGFLNFMYLGRAITHPGGFASHPAFQDLLGGSLYDNSKLVYEGNSQGGIMGGALVALSPDLTRGSLGVVGMNYSTLLNRSVDWEGPLVNPDEPDLPSYSSFLYTSFPDKQEQQLVMSLIQMLWDRAESNGYAQHMTTDPYLNTPAHSVMLHVALGDFQVTNFSAEVEARTIGARVMDTALADGRHWEIDPYFGLAPFDRNAGGALEPHDGSALVYWDSGNYLPPNANVPPLLDGGDPHEDPRRDPLSGDQRAHFFNTGEVIDVFGGAPYYLCRPGLETQIPRVSGQIPDHCPR